MPGRMGGVSSCLPPSSAGPAHGPRRGMEVRPEWDGLFACDAREVWHMDPEIDPDRIDDTVLALLWLGLHDGWRAWKGFDWDAMDRLHRKGMISDPVGKAKSVVFTEDGRREAERLFRELFARRP